MTFFFPDTKFYREAAEKLHGFSIRYRTHHLETLGLRTAHKSGYTAYSDSVFAYGKRTLETLLKKDHQFVQQQSTVWRNGFVCIDEKYLTIWHHGISKRQTKIEGNIEDWIKYFRTI